MSDAVRWLCLIHLLICVTAAVLMWRGIIRSRYHLFWAVVCIPVWGLICLLLLEHSLRRRKKRSAQTGIERLKMEDEIYRSIQREEGERAQGIVSFTDAAVMNSAKTRRELMMDILYSDASKYISLLKEARMDEDTEVVHYATTAMVELQKDYEQRVKEKEEAHRADPGNTAVIRSYIALLSDYIESGLLEGNMLLVRRKRCSELLETYLKAYPDEKELWKKKICSDMILGRESDAEDGIRTLLKRWPEDEEGYLLQIAKNAAEKNRSGIDDALRLIREKRIFLTAQGKAVVRYWTGEEGKENGR